MCRFWIISDGALMRGICVQEEQDLLQFDWVDEEVRFGEEQSNFSVSVQVKRAGHTKFTVNTRVSKKSNPTVILDTRKTQPLSRATVTNSWSLAKKTCSRL